MQMLYSRRKHKFYGLSNNVSITLVSGTYCICHEKLYAIPRKVFTYLLEGVKDHAAESQDIHIHIRELRNLLETLVNSAASPRGSHESRVRPRLSSRIVRLYGTMHVARRTT